MDLSARIEGLESTTFCGRRFTRQQITTVAETVSLLSLSRSEVAGTICEHLNWRAPNGRLKVNSALEFLEKLEKLGICKLPAARLRQVPSPHIDLPDSQAPCVELCITNDLSDIKPLTLKIVKTRDERKRFKTLMGHHYLGYKHPFGASLSYYIFDKDDRELGLLVFSAAAWSLKDRDEWIGWSKKHRLKRLHLVVGNSRFLILPHVSVQNLASHVLSLVAKQLPQDWQERYGYTPVLLETFVDQEMFFGTCYQAANWQLLGITKGRGRFGKGGQATKSCKDIYAYPLVANFRDVLLRKNAVAQRKQDSAEQLSSIHDDILGFWGHIAPLIRSIAADFDGTWQIKRRVIDSMLLVLLIFRLIASRGMGGYGTVIDGVWENCRKQGLPLSQKKPIAPSSLTVARQKLDENIFKVINSRVIHHYEQHFEREAHLFYGHRLFAVDGSMLNLPPALKAEGFKANQKNAHYPQGLMSALYRLRQQIPVDFSLSHDGNERKAALAHFDSLRKGDVVIYDRGYFSYAFLEAHIRNGIHGVFRLSSKTLKPITEFMKSSELERVMPIELAEKTRKDILKTNPDMIFRPLPVRLIRYKIDSDEYFLATTLTDARYPRKSFEDLYHERWGVEELYKVVKRLLSLETFHAKTLRGVKQEIYANFALITLNRIVTNYTDGMPHKSTKPSDGKEKKFKTNFNSALTAVSRNMETLLLASCAELRAAVSMLLGTLVRRVQGVRPNRSYPRRSLQPKSKWQTFKTRVSKAAKNPAKRKAA